METFKKSNTLVMVPKVIDSPKIDADVIIVGAGIAGLSVARGVAGEGRRVLVLEQKRDLLDLDFYTLGSFMDPEDFDLPDRVVASRVTEVRFHAPHFSFKKRGKACIIDKKILHSVIIDECKCKGVSFETGVRVVSSKLADGGISYIIDKKGKKYFSKIFVDCSGLSCVLSKMTGLQDSKYDIATGVEYNMEYTDPQYRSHLFLGKNFKGGYGWVFPLKNHRAIVGYGTVFTKIDSNIGTLFNSLIEGGDFGRCIKKDNEKMYAASFPLTGIKTNFVKQNLVCVGDCVSQVNPLVGEGYRFIMDAAKMASKYINTCLDSGDTGVLKGYVTKWNDKYYADYRRAKKVQSRAVRVSRSDLLSDIAAFILATKRNSTFSELLSGKLNWKRVLWP